jgi:hypothetical protein
VSSLAVSAETVGGHAQKKGVVEDYRRLIKTHEIRTLDTTVFEHAYRRLRMRVVFTCAPASDGEWQAEANNVAG